MSRNAHASEVELFSSPRFRHRALDRLATGVAIALLGATVATVAFMAYRMLALEAEQTAPSSMARIQPGRIFQRVLGEAFASACSRNYVEGFGSLTVRDRIWTFVGCTDDGYSGLAAFVPEAGAVELRWPMAQADNPSQMLGIAPGRDAGSWAILYRTTAPYRLLLAVVGRDGWLSPPTATPLSSDLDVLGMQWDGAVLEAVLQAPYDFDLSRPRHPWVLRWRPGEEATVAAFDPDPQYDWNRVPATTLGAFQREGQWWVAGCLPRKKGTWALSDRGEAWMLDAGECDAFTDPAALGAIPDRYSTVRAFDSGASLRQPSRPPLFGLVRLGDAFSIARGTLSRAPIWFVPRLEEPVTYTAAGALVRIRRADRQLFIASADGEIGSPERQVAAQWWGLGARPLVVPRAAGGFYVLDLAGRIISVGPDWSRLDGRTVWEHLAPDRLYATITRSGRIQAAVWVLFGWLICLVPAAFALFTHRLYGDDRWRTARKRAIIGLSLFVATALPALLSVTPHLS